MTRACGPPPACCRATVNSTIEVNSKSNNTVALHSRAMRTHVYKILCEDWISVGDAQPTGRVTPSSEEHRPPMINLEGAKGRPEQRGA